MRPASAYLWRVRPTEHGFRRVTRIYSWRLMPGACLVAVLAGCAPDISPDTYSGAAVQQVNKVDRGIVIGARKVDVSLGGATGALAGGAAGGAVGGAAGSQTPGGALGTALGAVGGSVIGGLVGAGVEHTVSDTSAYEYIVRKTNGDLVSVTQKDPTPLALGQHVLVIGGNQARLVPDYTVNFDSKSEDKAAAKAEAKPSGAATPAAGAPASPAAPTPLAPAPAAPTTAPATTVPPTTSPPTTSPPTTAPAAPAQDSPAPPPSQQPAPPPAAPPPAASPSAGSASGG